MWGAGRPQSWMISGLAWSSVSPCCALHGPLHHRLFTYYICGDSVPQSWMNRWSWVDFARGACHPTASTVLCSTTWVRPQSWMNRWSWVGFPRGFAAPADSACSMLSTSSRPIASALQLAPTLSTSACSSHKHFSLLNAEHFSLLSAVAMGCPRLVTPAGVSHVYGPVNHTSYSITSSPVIGTVRGS